MDKSLGIGIERPIPHYQEVRGFQFLIYPTRLMVVIHLQMLGIQTLGIFWALRIKLDTSQSIVK
jgi:hypothetical protein